MANQFKSIKFKKGIAENGEWDTYIYGEQELLSRFTFCGNYAIENDMLVTKGAFVLYDAQTDEVAWYDGEGKLDEVAPATPYPDWNAFIPWRHANKFQFYANNKMKFQTNDVFNIITKTQAQLASMAKNNETYSTDLTFILSNPEDIKLINGRLVKLPFKENLYFLECPIQAALSMLIRFHYIPNARMEVFQFDGLTFVVSTAGSGLVLGPAPENVIECEIEGFKLLRTHHEIDAGIDWGKIKAKPEKPDVFSDERIGWMGGKD